MERVLDTFLPSIGNPRIESGMAFPRYQGLDPFSFIPFPFRDTLQQILTERRTFEESRTHSPTTQESDQPIFSSLGLEDSTLFNGSILSLPDHPQHIPLSSRRFPAPFL